jgi:hypothetical protein
MPTLRELSTWIRDYCQDPRHQSRLLADQFGWHQLCTAMDIIDDTDSALAAYTDNEFPTETGEKYLRTYGVMQALFLQQDVTRPIFCTTANERVYITAQGCETELGGTKGL